MAITFALQTVTETLVTVLCTQDGVISSPPVAADGAATISNFRGAYTTQAGPLRDLANASRTGYGQLAAGALTQAQIRALLLSDDAAGAVLTNSFIGRAVARMTARDGIINWAVDAISDPASAVGFNDPSLRVSSEVGTAAHAYLNVEFRHSRDR